MVIWLIGPLLLVLGFMLLSWWRATTRVAVLRQVRLQSGRSDSALSDALADAMTRLRGQELAQRARYDVLDSFVHQIAEGLPAGIIVLSPQGHIRLTNRWAVDWLHLPEPVTGRILWNVEGTDTLRALAQASLDDHARRDGTVSASGADGRAFPVTAIPLTTAAGDVDGVMCLVHHERVS
jgi:nitrogen fixation/metabolism regulation signal transduction histidine kinase